MSKINNLNASVAFVDTKPHYILLSGFVISYTYDDRWKLSRRVTESPSHQDVIDPSKKIKILRSNIFWIATIVLFALFSVQYFPKTSAISVNGIYELFCIMVVFPLIVWIAASSDSAQSKFTLRLSKFFGDLSYPLYIVHYPVMYLFYAWLIENQYYTLGETWPMVILVLTVCIVLAYACLKLYDEPIRKRLSKKFLS